MAFLELKNLSFHLKLLSCMPPFSHILVDLVPGDSKLGFNFRQINIKINKILNTGHKIKLESDLSGC